MKIKTRLQLITIFSVAIALAIGLVLFLTVQRVNKEINTNKITDEAARGVFELNAITYEYLLHYEERMQAQWQLRHDSLTKLLSEIEFRGTERQVVLGRIQQNHEGLKSLFSQLVENYERQGDSKKKIALELEERLAGQLLAKSQAMVSEAFQLSVQSQAMIVIAQQRAASLITIFITLIIAIMAAVSFMFGRSVAKPIGKLHEGTEIIGAGNLNYRVGTPAKDEIGQLSRAFDRMTESLRQQAVVLEESENKFRDMAEKSIVGVYLIQDGVFRYANPMLAEIFGYSVEELIDKKGPKDLVLPEDWPIVEENLRKRISGEIESINYDFRGITKDKETIYVEVYGSKTAYRGRPAVIGTLLDITEQKMAKGALQASEEKFRNIVERSYDVIVTTDTTGRIIYISPSVEKISDFKANEIAGENFLSFVSEQDIVKASQAFAGVINEGRSVSELEVGLLRKDGTKIAAEVNASPMLAEGAAVGVQIIFKDITERKKAEEEKKASYQTQNALNELLRLSMENIPLTEQLEKAIDITLSVPFISLEPKGAIFLVEDQPEALALKAHRNLPPALQNMCKSVPFGKCLCGRAAVSQKIEFADSIDERHETGYAGMKPHGHYVIPFLSGGKALGVMVFYLQKGHRREKREEEFLQAIGNTLTGIIERKQAEESLRKSEERYKRLLASITDYIYTVKVENGRPVSTTHGIACVAITGYTPKEYEADPYLWYQMIHEGDREAVMEQVNKVLSGEAVKPLEHRIIHKDESIRWVRNAPVPRHDERGRVVAYDGLITDITGQKKLEDQLRQAQKMEAIGQLAGGIAHDFNNMLNVIIGFGNLIEMNTKADDPNRDHLKEILNAGERATHLTQSLLAFSRKQIIDLRPQDLNEIIKGVEKFLRRIIGEDIELKTELPDKELTVFADRGQIEQILMNLATNARDAMPEGGDLIIETGTIQINEEYVKRHGYGEAGTYALLSVTDSGLGMDEKTRQRIFEPFFTTKEMGRGTGLGLAMVYGIAKQHNGFINVYSEPQKGTTFKIYLPLTKSAVEESVGAATAAYPEGGTETVLVAEDDQALRKLTRVVLEDSGYKVIAAADGEDAIEKFRENKEAIQLLLLDVIMPKKNGKEAYEEIKKINPQIKALFLSGYTANLIHKKGILEKGLDFILKPVSPKELLKKVREMLDK